MKHCFETHPKIVGAIGAIISFAIATAYYFFTPPEAAEATGLQWLILTYAHSLVWVCMAAASTLFALNKWHTARAILMYAALALYVLFIITLLAAKLL